MIELTRNGLKFKRERGTYPAGIAATISAGGNGAKNLLPSVMVFGRTNLPFRQEIMVRILKMLKRIDCTVVQE